LETVIEIFTVSAFFFCLLVMAQEHNRWHFDSLRADSRASKPYAQPDYDVLPTMLVRGNAHDIQGHLDVYWKSPEFWQQLHDSYVNEYPDRTSMGLIQPKRIQVKLLEPDLALALTWWSVSFPSSEPKAVGNTTTNLKKFRGGRKILASRTSLAAI
jgi:hypothetical protein